MLDKRYYWGMIDWACGDYKPYWLETTESNVKRAHPMIDNSDFFEQERQCRELEAMSRHTLVGGKISFPTIDVALRELQREAREQYENPTPIPKPISSDFEACLHGLPKKIKR